MQHLIHIEDITDLLKGTGWNRKGFMLSHHSGVRVLTETRWNVDCVTEDVIIAFSIYSSVIHILLFCRKSEDVLLFQVADNRVFFKTDSHDLHTSQSCAAEVGKALGFGLCQPGTNERREHRF